MTWADDGSSTCDSDCSLRGASNPANTNDQNYNPIVFAPAASGVSIANNPLPVITDPGLTVGGADNNTYPWISGANSEHVFLPLTCRRLLRQACANRKINLGTVRHCTSGCDQRGWEHHPRRGIRRQWLSQQWRGLPVRQAGRRLGWRPDPARQIDRLRRGGGRWLRQLRFDQQRGDRHRRRGLPG